MIMNSEGFPAPYDPPPWKQERWVMVDGPSESRWRKAAALQPSGYHLLENTVIDIQSYSRDLLEDRRRFIKNDFNGVVRLNDIRKDINMREGVVRYQGNNQNIGGARRTSRVNHEVRPMMQRATSRSIVHTFHSFSQFSHLVQKKCSRTGKLIYESRHTLAEKWGTP
uniref:Uncharacterized protein n=1 Tax=Timema monikensis TaxID=170555 RepID=A0A7R9EH79_9NEOP|nr:unnamed protein product [Timema monikensis]